MKRFFLAGMVLTAISLSSCKKDDLELEWNDIIINNVNSSYVQANDCTTSIGAVGTNITFAIDINNVKNETIKNVELDVLYANGAGYYSYNYTSYTLNGSIINQDVCRPFYGEDYFDIRVFIVTEDDLRSRPKTYRLYKPQ